MKRGAMIVIVLMAVSAVLVLSHSGAAAPGAAAPSPSVIASSSPLAGIQFTDPMHRFQAVFVGAPKSTSTTNPAGVRDETYVYRDPATGIEEFVSILTYPAGTSPGTVADVSNENAGFFQGAIVSSTPLTFDTYTAVDEVLSIPGNGSPYYLELGTVLPSNSRVIIIGCSGGANPPTDFAAFANAVTILR